MKRYTRVAIKILPHAIIKQDNYK